jgi:replicative DNA helicase
MTGPIHDIETEQALLGGLIGRGDALAVAEKFLRGPEDFFEPAHQDLYTKFQSTRADGYSMTLPVVRATLGAFGEVELGGLTIGEYTARLAAAACLPSEVADLARATREKAQRRELIAVADTLRSLIEGDAPIIDAATEAISVIDGIVAVNAAAHARPMMIAEAGSASIERMQCAVQNPGSMPGITTGLRSLDARTGGLQRGDFIVLAGRPGMGKSALAITMARLQATAGYNVLLFALEMNSPDVADRAIADAAWRGPDDPIPYQSIRLGRVTREQQQRLTEAAREFADLALLIEQQSGLSLSQIAARARKHKQALERQGKTLDVLVLDHLHIVKASNRYQGKPVQEITEISNGLKALAKELNVPVVAMAQLNRGVESRENKRPSMSDLRESGAIEQDADLIALVYRESYYLDKPTGGTAAQESDRLNRLSDVQNLIEVDIAKQRNGPTGVVTLFTDIACNVFRDLTVAE